jgi:hypothetical protein
MTSDTVGSAANPAAFCGNFDASMLTDGGIPLKSSHGQCLRAYWSLLQVARLLGRSSA